MELVTKLIPYTQKVMNEKGLGPMKKKVIITLSLSWLLIVGYLTWYNGLKASGRYKGFNWEEWFWFGLIPLLAVYIFYFIWKPEAFKDLVKDVRSLFN